MDKHYIDQINLLDYTRIQIYFSTKNFQENLLFRFKVKMSIDKKVLKEQAFALNGDIDFRVTHPFEIHFIFERQQIIHIEFQNKARIKFDEVQFTVGELIGSRFNSISRTLKSDEKFEFKAMFEGILPSQNQEVRESYQRLFVDYLKGKLNLSAMTCIDFTASNQAIRNNQLHRVNNFELNEYQQAIAAVCKIILDYDHDQLVPMFGFGAVPLMPGFDPSTVSHFFPLTGDWDNPAGKGIMEVFQIYSGCITKVKMAGPTLFGPLLEETIKFTKKTFEKNKFHYTILLLLTDGIIHDMEDTIDQIVEAANYPISILIVGVGTEDFTCMHVLDSDGQIMRNSKGHVAKRDIVQFVDYSKFKHRTLDDLVAEVLKEVPKQICTFYKFAGIDPREDVVKRAAGDELEFEPVKTKYSVREIPEESDGAAMHMIPDFKADKLISNLNKMFQNKRKSKC